MFDSTQAPVVNPSTSDHYKTRESTTALATKKKKAYVCIKRVKSDSYLTYGQSCKTYGIIRRPPLPPRKKNTNKLIYFMKM